MNTRTLALTFSAWMTLSCAPEELSGSRDLAAHRNSPRCFQNLGKQSLPDAMKFLKALSKHIHSANNLKQPLCINLTGNRNSIGGNAGEGEIELDLGTLVLARELRHVATVVSHELVHIERKHDERNYFGDLTQNILNSFREEEKQWIDLHWIVHGLQGNLYSIHPDLSENTQLQTLRGEYDRSLSQTLRERVQERQALKNFKSAARNQGGGFESPDLELFLDHKLKEQSSPDGAEPQAEESEANGETGLSHQELMDYPKAMDAWFDGLEAEAKKEVQGKIAAWIKAKKAHEKNFSHSEKLFEGIRNHAESLIGAANFAQWHEVEADELGTKYFFKAGFRSYSSFDRLQLCDDRGKGLVDDCQAALQCTTQGGGRGTDDYPPRCWRIAHAEKVEKSLGTKEANSVELKNLETLFQAMKKEVGSEFSRGLREPPRAPEPEHD